MSPKHMMLLRKLGRPVPPRAKPSERQLQRIFGSRTRVWRRRTQPNPVVVKGSKPQRWPFAVCGCEHCEHCEPRAGVSVVGGMMTRI